MMSHPKLEDPVFSSGPLFLIANVLSKFIATLLNKLCSKCLLTIFQYPVHIQVPKAVALGRQDFSSFPLSPVLLDWFPLSWFWELGARTSEPRATYVHPSQPRFPHLQTGGDNSSPHRVTVRMKLDD